MFLHRSLRQVCLSIRSSLTRTRCGEWERKRFSDLAVCDNRTFYEVIVVGGGHAGCEAAAAAARMGANTLLVTHKIEKIGEMSCNPSFGGTGKGHLMREIDALDGLCSRLCDLSGVHFRLLNRSKGEAVWGLRAQIDRDQYRENMQKEILSTPNLTVRATSVEDLVLTSCHDNTSESSITGIVLGSGEVVRAKSIILTTGTFLRAQIYIGMSSTPAGRRGDEPSVGLAKTLEAAGFVMGRLKTGTPPRIKQDSIDFSVMNEQEADERPVPFSFLHDVPVLKKEQMLCWKAATNKKTHEVVFVSLDMNRPVKEDTTGPRYCPSLESKVMRYPNLHHRLFLEPEGRHTNTIYPQGFAVTMPEEYQLKAIRTIPGMERAEMISPGYGVEYDFVDPRQLRPSLETRLISGLFFAGQLNGTTGYEEAAAQGLVAGINAVQYCRDRPAFVLSRADAYIGVLIDDITTHGCREPYRMFTSRSEYRLSLRPDNADQRLTEKGYKIGVVGEERFKQTLARKVVVDNCLHLLKSIRKPGQIWQELVKLKVKEHTVRTAFDMLAIPGVSLSAVVDACDCPELTALRSDFHAALTVQVQGKYAAFLNRQADEIEMYRREESLELPEDIDYDDPLLNLSEECREKLSLAKPPTIAAAGRVAGVTPAAIVFLLRYVKRVQDKKTVVASI